MSSETPRVVSFVLRFVADTPTDRSISTAAASPSLPSAALQSDAPDREQAPDVARWHGVIVHVQTNEVKPFTHLADALAFIDRYVPIGDFVFEKPDGAAK
jgi:hypothetical protein